MTARFATAVSSALLIIIVACDKGEVAPAPGSTLPANHEDPSSDPQDKAAGAALQVRLCNDTGGPITDLTFHDTFTETAPVADHACTRYRGTKRAYGYTYVQFKIGSDVYTIQPTDFIGETPLANGRWSWHVTVVDRTTHQADVKATRD